MFAPTANSLKRGREDEAACDTADGGMLGFTEHRNKRLHTLPLRGGPSLGTWSPPSTIPESFSQHMPNAITPSDSESDEAAGQFGRFAPLQHEQLQSRSHYQDADVDMMMDSVEDESGSSNATANLEPGSFHPDSVGTSINGRMPTPILPSFAAQVRGNNWGGAAGNVMQSGNTADHQPQYVNHADGSFTSSPRGMSMVTTPVHDRTVPRSLEHSSAMMADWSMVQNRPLPSPISESGGEEIGSPDMDSVGTRALPSSPPQEHPNLHQYAQHSPPQQRQGSPGAESTSPSPKKGHTRSRHTVNNWTQNLGMKKSFSIGYRADCEKCRLKVPGHFNHIIVS
ncbi:hypothetical protein MAPG_06290 [Magnaporthiopsis poae ATCC 64411]|uniref:Uncharacterized protein n=1 Tax=Magnaporthiopsis poae (strain ATCC 64411 / 73-15) TaxID=644358 RepID=A0A0C4E1M5_MAGP6|nr:hypothetical protein MAPG_06290 [Magnaporthiopsis poae ATCC 64411]